MVFFENIFAVRAHMVDGSCVDLLLFADPDRALDHAKGLVPLPLGFDYLEIIERRVIGDVVERRTSPRRATVEYRIR